MRPAQFADRSLNLGCDPPRMVKDPVRSVLKARDAVLPVTLQPGVHALAAAPYRSATSVTGTPAPTSNTAR